MSEKKITGIIFLLFFIVIVILEIPMIEQASPEDFKPLYEQAELIDGNIEAAFGMENVAFGPLETNLRSVTISSSKCDLILSVLTNGKIVSFEEKDKSWSLAQAIFTPFLGAILITWLSIHSIVPWLLRLKSKCPKTSNKIK